MSSYNSNNNRNSSSSNSNNNSNDSAFSKTNDANGQLTSVPKLVSPSFSPLYFERLPRVATTVSTDTSTLQQLPLELWSKCLLEYSDWGDLARLSAVCRLFRTVVQDAAQAGGKDAQWSLANAYLEGSNGLSRQPHRAVDYLTELAGVAEPQVLQIGAAENYDNDNDNDDDEAMAAATFAASSSSSLYFAPAMTKLADYYLEETAMGVQELDDDNAKDLPETKKEEVDEEKKENDDDADDVDDVDADKTTNDNNVVDKVETAAEEEVSPNLGLSWLHAAFHYGGDLDAAFRLANIYEEGSYGTSVDIVAATSWYRRAAVRGHVEAMAEYALCLELGTGMESAQVEESVSWYVRAANAGHVHAASCVGEAFEEGKGVPQSHLEACRWYFCAAQGGDEESQQVLEGRLSDVARILLPSLVASSGTVLFDA